MAGGASTPRKASAGRKDSVLAASEQKSLPTLNALPTPKHDALYYQARKRFRAHLDEGEQELDREALRRLVESLGRDLSEHDLDAALGALDTSGNGRVSFDEFFEWFKNGLSVKALLEKAHDALLSA